MISLTASKCIVIHRVMPSKGEFLLKWVFTKSSISIPATRIRYFVTNYYDKRNRAENLGSGDEDIYLHISPDGDYWISGEIFAAKHLQPEYVRSIPMCQKEKDDFERVTDSVHGSDCNMDVLMKQVYDTGKLSYFFKGLENPSNAATKS